MPTPPTAALRAYRTNSVLFAVFGAAGIMFVGVGAAGALQQRHVLAHSFPVRATVVGRDVERHSPTGRNGTTYRPVVRFEYQIDNATRMGDQVGPMRESRSGHWAWSVLDRYEVGQHVTAWVRDDVPDVAYLDHSASATPYVMLGFGVTMTAIVAWSWMRYRRRANAHGSDSLALSDP